jgi:hypothetical protein
MKSEDPRYMEHAEAPRLAIDAAIATEPDEREAREFISELVDVTSELAELIASVNSEPD